MMVGLGSAVSALHCGTVHARHSPKFIVAKAPSRCVVPLTCMQGEGSQSHVVWDSDYMLL